MNRSFAQDYLYKTRSRVRASVPAEYQKRWVRDGKRYLRISNVGISFVFFCFETNRRGNGTERPTSKEMGEPQHRYPTFN